jgi:mono/diheme cytochrome c family protein
MRFFRCCEAAAVLVAIVCPIHASAQDDAPPAGGFERGKALVVQNCSGCHSIGLVGASRHPQAPPFRELSERFPIDALEETFVESIDTGHPGMPVFEASRQQIRDIIDYIGSIME